MGTKNAAESINVERIVFYIFISSLEDGEGKHMAQEAEKRKRKVRSRWRGGGGGGVSHHDS
jgi:hypothetical protein